MSVASASVRSEVSGFSLLAGGSDILRVAAVNSDLYCSVYVGKYDENYNYISVSGIR